MSKTIKFFNVSIYLNDNKTDLSFVDMIDRIARNQWQNRLRKVDNYPTAIISLGVVDATKRIIPIGKYRQDYKPFVGDLSTQRLDPIDNDVVELVTLLYDSTYKALAMDYSQYGLKASGIEKYFNTFLPQDADNFWQVKLEPIHTRLGIEALRDSRQIRSIELTFNLREFNTIVYERRYQGRGRTRLIMDFLTQAKQSLDAQTLKMEFVSGGSARDTMNLQTALAILEGLDEDNRERYISKFRVKYRNNTTEEINMVDLKNLGGQLKDTILKDSTNKNPYWGDVGIEMIDSYNNYSNEIQHSYNEYINNITAAEEPEFYDEPRDIHRVPVLE